MDLGGPDISEIRSLAERSRSLLGEMRAKAAVASTRRRDELDRFGGDATQLIERIAAQIASELADDLAKRHAADQEAHRHDVARLREELEAERGAWLAERSEWEAVRDEVEAELGVREGALAEQESRLATESVRDDSAHRAAIDELNASLGNERLRTAEAEAGAAALTGEVESLTAALAEASAQVGALAATPRELAELRGKFEMALEDLGRHRARVAELEEELSTRPAPGETEGAEAALLRQERDDLAAQVDQLMASPIATVAADDGEIDDLRRRFEMAVEDVRRLKTEKGELEDRLAAGGGQSAAPDAGGNDWESQKRRLLAALESEGEPSDTERQRDRATIQGTLQITDNVVAEKDREIQRLCAELETASGLDIGSVDAATAALLDEDELIKAGRERIQVLERALEEKVRTAELELSFERAQIARAQSEVAEQALELQTLRAAAAGQNPAVAGEARRNWLNKLGLGGAEV
ncbi:MAG: hypothetical protein ACRCT8_01900 [Lacipirellulaceae bacterium]